MARRTLIDEQLREAIRTSGITAYQLAKDADVFESQIGRFMRKERGIGLATAARLAEALGLELSPVRDRREKGES